MRPHIVLLLCSLLGWPLLLASQESHSTKPLTNTDVMDMLSAGVSQEIVIAKIKKSTCEFDTSPATLKALKAANIPDAVILAMIQAPVEPHSDAVAVKSVGDTAIPAHVVCDHLAPVPVYFGPSQQPNSVELFKVNCGDSVTIVEPIKSGSMVRIRTMDGRTGYVAWARLAMQAGSEPVTQAQTQNVSAEMEKQVAKKKSEEMQKASDDLEDCRTQAQNEYDTKMNAVNAITTLTPIQRVYASTRLKQNLDAENRTCRSRYEARVRAIEAE